MKAVLIVEPAPATPPRSPASSTVGIKTRFFAMPSPCRDRNPIASGILCLLSVLRFALPKGLRAIRYYGWCHPAAKVKREKIALATGRPLLVGDWEPTQTEQVRQCPRCAKDLRQTHTILPRWRRDAQLAQPAPT